MFYTAAILYVLGSFMYSLHQKTVIFFMKEEDYSEVKVLINSLIWPFRVFQLMLAFVLNDYLDDDKDED